MGIKEYSLLSINYHYENPNATTRIRIDVTTKLKNSEDIVHLKNISLPAYVEIGDLIRKCEHNYYDVIDENGDFIYR